MTPIELRTYCESVWADDNVKAFSWLVRLGEGTAGKDGYRTMFTGRLFDSFADHPRKINEARIGGAGSIKSSAAGAYQFLSRTWDECASALGLSDFSPASQDLAFVYLLRRRKAIAAIQDGDIVEAMNLCRLEWASLPGSPYGQPTQKAETAIAYYVKHGGRLAQKSVPTTNPSDPAPPASPASNPEPGTAPPQSLFPAAAQETTVTPLVLGLATTLIDIFTPLAKEKLTKAMNKQTDDPKVADAVAEAVVTAAKQVTGLADPVAAVAAVKADQELVGRVEGITLDEFEKMAPLIERMRKMDEDSVRAAREFNANNSNLLIDTKIFKVSFVQFLSLGLVSFSGWFASSNWASLTPELKGAVITLMVIAGWNGVRDYWMGSTDGSQRKTDEILRRTKPSA